MDQNTSGQVADAMMDKFKADHPEIDWDKHEVYAVINNETMTVDRIGVMPKRVASQMADLTQAGDYKTLLLEANNMDWHEGTWTMTEGQFVTWTVDGDEVLFNVAGNLADEVDVYLSERQAENMIAGLSYQLNRIREERGRG